MACGRGGSALLSGRYDCNTGRVTRIDGWILRWDGQTYSEVWRNVERLVRWRRIDWNHLVLLGRGKLIASRVGVLKRTAARIFFDPMTHTAVPTNFWLYSRFARSSKNLMILKVHRIYWNMGMHEVIHLRSIEEKCGIHK